MCNKNKRFDHTYQMQEKMETYQNLNLIDSRRPTFGDDISVIFIS